MTTLGYGDITPDRVTAQLLVILELSLSVYFLVVLIARVIAWHAKARNGDQIMTSDSNCIFCKQDAIKDTLPSGISCRRDIYEDERSFAILAPEQYTIGHTLLILKNHKADITDNLSESDLSAFINAIHKVSVQLKNIVHNDQRARPDRIYVCILCDGVKHVHAHLIPRYPFTQQDKDTYRTIFAERDSEDKVDRAIEKGDLGGYWYIAEREKNWKSSEFGRKSSSEQAEFLEKLADQLRTAR